MGFYFYDFGQQLYIIFTMSETKKYFWHRKHYVFLKKKKKVVKSF